MFVWSRRLDDQMPVSGELVNARKVLADEEVARNRALHMVGHRVRRFVYVIASEGSLVPILDVLIGWSFADFGYMSCTDMWPSRV